MYILVILRPDYGVQWGPKCDFWPYKSYCYIYETKELYSSNENKGCPLSCPLEFLGLYNASIYLQLLLLCLFTLWLNSEYLFLNALKACELSWSCTLTNLKWSNLFFPDAFWSLNWTVYTLSCWLYNLYTLPLSLRSLHRGPVSDITDSPEISAAA